MSTWLLLETEAHPFNDLLTHGAHNMWLRIRRKDGEDADGRIDVAATERAHVADALVEDTPLGRLWRAAETDCMADIPEAWEHNDIGELFGAMQYAGIRGLKADEVEAFLQDLAKEGEDT